MVCGLNYYQTFDTFPSYLHFPLYGENDYLYLVSCINESETYLLVDDFTPGDTVTVDLANLSNPRTSGINFHLSTDQYLVSFNGYQTLI